MPENARSLPRSEHLAHTKGRLQTAPVWQLARSDPAEEQLHKREFDANRDAEEWSLAVERKMDSGESPTKAARDN